MSDELKPEVNKTNRVEGWEKKDLVSPSPYIATAEYHVTSVPALEGVVPDDISAQVDAKIDELIATPEIQAMLGNAVQGVVDNAIDDAAAELGLASSELSNSPYSVGKLRDDFEEFKARVEKAFKHAGFKF